MRRVIDRPVRVAAHFQKQRSFPSANLYESTGMRKISVPFGKKSTTQHNVPSSFTKRDELRKRSVQVLPNYLREEFSSHGADTKSVKTISAEAIRMVSRRHRKSHAPRRTGSKISQASSHNETSSIQLHPCLLQSPGGICSHNNASGARCPYRNAPRDICINFLQTGTCTNIACPWLHEDVSVYYARISERSKGHIFLPRSQEATPHTGRSPTLTQNAPPDSLARPTSRKTSFAEWMHVCRDALVVCNALTKAPGCQLSLYGLEICLKREMEPRAYAPGYVLYLVSLHSSLMTVVDGSSVKWKACRLTAHILDRSTRNSTEATRKEEVIRGNLKPLCSLPHICIQNPLQSLAAVSTSSGQSRYDAFFHNSMKETQPSPTPRISRRIHPPQSMSDSVRPVGTIRRHIDGTNYVSELYHIYWKVLEECTQWDEAWQHLTQLAHLHTLWVPNSQDECSRAFLRSMLIPPGLVRHMIALFSASFHKWQHHREFISLFSRVSCETLPDVGYCRLPELFSQYQTRILDLTAMSRVYPFLVVQRVDALRIDCSSFLPKRANWLAEVVLSRHNGVLPTPGQQGGIKVSRGDIAAFTTPTYFIVRQQSVHLFHEFFSELLLRSIHQEKNHHGMPPSERDALSFCSSREDYSSVRTSPPAGILKYYLLSCLQVNKVRLSIRRLRSILLFQSTHHTLPLPLDDVGYALVLKTLYRARRMITLWKFYAILMKTTRKPHGLPSRCLDTICTEQLPIAPEIYTNGNERAQRMMPESEDFLDEEKEKYFPVCTELMLRYACRTHEDVVKVMWLVIRRTPSKPMFSTAHIYSHQRAELSDMQKQEIDIVSASNCPPCRFRVFRTAILKLMELKMISLSSDMFLQHIDWATNENAYDSQSFRISKTSNEYNRKYQFPDRKEEITRLAEYILHNLNNTGGKSETLSTLNQWIDHHKQVN